MAVLCRIDLFGGLLLACRGEEITHFSRQRTASLLAYLAYYLGQDHPRLKLVDLLWPDKDEQTGLASLRNELTVLRKCLKPVGMPVEAVLLATNRLVRLNPETVTTDVRRFEETTRMAAETDAGADRMRLLEEAASLYRGELLPGYYDSWIPTEQQRLKLLYLDAVDQLIRHYEATPERALQFAVRAAEVDSDNEEAHRKVMRLYAAAGQASAAFQYYQELEQRLLNETGAPPEPLTQALARQILRLVSPSGREGGDGAARFAADSALPASPFVSPAVSPAAGDARNGESLSQQAPRIIPWGEAVCTAYYHPRRTNTLQNAAESSQDAGSEIENWMATALVIRVGASGESSTGLDEGEIRSLASQGIAAVLARYDGRPHSGLHDRVLAYFGAFQVHEDDPERAILAALEILDLLRSLDCTASCGIHTGDGAHQGIAGQVLWEPRRMGNRPAADNLDLAPSAGDSSDLAPSANRGATAPLPGEEREDILRPAVQAQRQAQPGQIVVTAATYHHTHRAFLLSPIGPEGTSIPGECGHNDVPRVPLFYRVDRRRLQPTKTRGIEGLRTPMVGRDTELSRVRKAYADALRQKGQIVSIIGEAGVGKSRLVSEMKRTVVRQDEAQGRTLWLEGRGLEMQMATSYSLVADLLRGYLASCSRAADADPTSASDWDESPDSSLNESLGRSIAHLVDRGLISRESAGPLSLVLKGILSLPLTPTEQEEIRLSQAGQTKEKIFTAVREYLLALSRQRPLVLIFEDLHWADPLSIELIAFLMEVVPTAPILLLCIYRPDRDQRCWRLGNTAAHKYRELYSEISVQELSDRESGRLIQSLLRMDEIPPVLNDRVLERGHGNPFFIEEILRTLIEDGMIYRSEGGWAVREGIEERSLPQGIQSVILARTDLLPTDLRRLLQVASVMGRLFRKRVLQYLAPASVDLDRSLWELEDHALIYQDRVLPEEEYSFKHVITQGALYRSIAPQRRTELHRKVAEAIEALYPDRLDELAEELGQHYSRGAHPVKAAEYLGKAGEKALRRGDHLRAEVCFSEALGLLSPEDRRTRASLLCRVADSLHWQAGQVERSIQAAEAGLAALGDDTTNPEAVNLLEVLMRSYWAKNDYETARRYGIRVREILPHVPYFDAMHRIYYGNAWVEINLGNFEGAWQWLKDMEALCIQHNSSDGLARCYHGFGDWHAKQKLHHESCRWYIRSLHYCERAGDIHYSMEGHLELAYNMILSQGTPRVIQGHIRKGLAIAEEMTRSAAVPELPIYFELLVLAYLRQGQERQAAIVLNRAIEMGLDRPGLITRIGQRCEGHNCAEAFSAFSSLVSSY